MLALLLTHTYFNVVYSNGIKDKSFDVARGLGFGPRLL